MRTFIVATALCLASFAARAEQMGPEGPWLSACYTRVDWARDIARQNAAIAGGRYYELGGLDARTLIDAVNAHPPVSNLKADTWMVQVSSDEQTVMVGRAYQGCVEDIETMSKDDWDTMTNDAINSES